MKINDFAEWFCEELLLDGRNFCAPNIHFSMMQWFVNIYTNDF